MKSSHTQNNRYGEYEAINGAIANGLQRNLDMAVDALRLASTEFARLERVYGCDKSQFDTWEKIQKALAQIGGEE